jgi:Holliday junction resolvasome RuvABC endonuclease subunit
MIYFGLDQSFTSSGYCILNKDNIIDFGVIKTNPEDGDNHDRVHIIINKLEEIYNNHENVKLSMEGLSFGNNGNAIRNLAGLQYVIINKFKYELKIGDITIISPKTVKKFATGSGGSAKAKVTKPMMFAALPEDVKVLFKSKYKVSSGLYDIVDAYWIAKYNQSNIVEEL